MTADTWLTPDNIVDLVTGAQVGVLSATTTYPGILEGWVSALLERRPVRLIPPSAAVAELGTDAHGVTFGVIGSLIAMQELPPGGGEFERALDALSVHTGLTYAAIAGLNAAGTNALWSVAAASALGLPLIDVDGMGRVFPLIDQTTYALGGLNPAPLAGVGPWGDLLVVDSTPSRSDILTRSAVTASGGWLLCALYSAPVSALVTHGIPGSFVRCLEVGENLRSRSSGVGRRLAALVGGELLASGHIVDIIERDTTAHSRQPAQPVSILLQDQRTTGDLVRLEVRNEAVFASVDGTVVATVPDTICLLDPHRRRAVDLLDLTVGDDLDVLVIPADPRWHSQDALELGGPRAFDVPLDAKAVRA